MSNVKLRDDDIVKFREALACEDDVGKVIRSHICIEVLINDFLNFSLLRPEYLKETKLDYSGRVSLSVCLGLNEELKKPLSFIGTLRNSFAHRLDQAINNDNMNNFYSSFSSTQKADMQEIWKSSESRLSHVPTKFKDMSPSERFILLSMALYYMLKIEISKYLLNDEIAKHYHELGKLYCK